MTTAPHAEMRVVTDALDPAREVAADVTTHAMIHVMDRVRILATEIAGALAKIVVMKTVRMTAKEAVGTLVLVAVEAVRTTVPRARAIVLDRAIMPAVAHR